MIQFCPETTTIVHLIYRIEKLIKSTFLLANRLNNASCQLCRHLFQVEDSNQNVMIKQQLRADKSGAQSLLFPDRAQVQPISRREWNFVFPRRRIDLSSPCFWQFTLMHDRHWFPHGLVSNKCLVCEVQSKPNSSLENRNFGFPLKYVVLDAYPERRTFLHLIHRIFQGSRSCLNLCRRYNSHPQDRGKYCTPVFANLDCHEKSLWKIEVFFLENENCNF